MRKRVGLALGLFLSSTLAAYAVDPGYAPGSTTRVSVSSDGTPSAGTTLQGAVLSRDGRFAVFVSNATNLVAGASGLQVYRHDRVTGETVLVSVSTGGGPAQAGAFAPTVSGDGRFVAFVSQGSDLVQGDANGTLDVFVRDMRDGTTVAASTDALGAFVSAGGSLAGFAGARALSDDGRRLAFTSTASDLTDPANNGVAQAYLKDLVTGAVTRVSVNGAGEAGNVASFQAVVSGDGHAVAFQTASTNLSPLATSGAAQIYVRDVVAGTTTLASVDASGVPMTFAPASFPGLSYTGNAVVFDTPAQLAAADLDGAFDVYVRDLAAGSTTLASPSANTTFGVDSRGPAISSDGAYVGFHSVDAGLVAGDANGAVDVFLFSRATGLLTIVSLSDGEAQANSASSAPSLSAGATQVLFASLATNLVGTSSTGVQLYVRDLATNAAPLVVVEASVSLVEGQALHASGSFTDLDASTSWTATVQWGDGSATDTLALASDKTFVLEHAYAPGAYVATVAVVDDAGATGTAHVQVSVANVAPSIQLGSSALVSFGTALAVSGSFSDPGSGEAYVATVSWGDGVVAPLALDMDPGGSSGRFQLRHSYPAAGTYLVTVTVADDNGGTASAVLRAEVGAYTLRWLDPVDETFAVGRVVPVKFAVYAADGGFVADRSVRVEVRSASGAVVAGPYLYGDQPSRSVTVYEGAYHANVDTRGFAAGTYSLVVSFSSDRLSGEIALASAPLAKPLR